MEDELVALKKKQVNSLSFEVVEVPDETVDVSENENTGTNLEELIADLLVRYWMEKHNNKASLVTAEGGEHDSKVEFDNRSGEGGDDDHVQLGKRRERSKIAEGPDLQRCQENQKKG